jgi:hypothetical protein
MPHNYNKDTFKNRRVGRNTGERSPLIALCSALLAALTHLGYFNQADQSRHFTGIRLFTPVEGETFHDEGKYPT